MSVGRSGGSLPGYDGLDDLRMQHVSGTMESSNSDRANQEDDAGWRWYPGIELEPAPERDDAAELVAIETNEAMARVRNSSPDTNPGNIDGRVTFSYDTLAYDAETGAITSDGDANRGTVSDTEGELSVFVDDSTDIVHADVLLSSNDWNDTTNGTGAGADLDRAHRFIKNFRHQFGAGPVFDRHDRLYLNSILQGIGAPDATWQIVFDYTLYWNDFDVDQIR